MAIRTETAISIDPAALQKLSQFLSPAFPVGAFAFSHGLEWAISNQDVTDEISASQWIATCLNFGAGRNDMILLAHAYRAETPEQLAEIAELAAALAPSHERHIETMEQGAALVTTLNKVWGSDLKPMAYPVALGAAAQVHAIPLAATLVLYGQAFVANLVSATVRFMPLGQIAGQKIIAVLHKDIARLATETIKAELSEIGSCALGADIASMKHESQKVRIFKS